jgi:hypothetical protein
MMRPLRTRLPDCLQVIISQVTSADQRASTRRCLAVLLAERERRGQELRDRLDGRLMSSRVVCDLGAELYARIVHVEVLAGAGIHDVVVLRLA